jgi:hypothetical protein
MTTTTATGPTTAPAIQVGNSRGLPIGDVLEAEVGVEVVELDKVPSVLGAEVIVAGIARYKVQALHPFQQSTAITDDLGVAGLWLNTMPVLQRRPVPLHRGNVIMAI